MEVISCSRMSNQSRILLEDHRTAAECCCVCVCVWGEENEKGEGDSEIHAERERERKRAKMISQTTHHALPSPAGQPNKHSVHLRPLRASRTSKTFTKYPLTTHSLLFVSAVLFISLHSSLPRSISISGKSTENSLLYSVFFLRLLPPGCLFEALMESRLKFRRQWNWISVRTLRHSKVDVRFQSKQTSNRVHAVLAEEIVQKHGYFSSVITKLIFVVLMKKCLLLVLLIDSHPSPDCI